MTISQSISFRRKGTPGTSCEINLRKMTWLFISTESHFSLGFYIQLSSVSLSWTTHQEISLPKEVGIINHVGGLCLLAQGLQISKQFSYSKYNKKELEHRVPEQEDKRDSKQEKGVTEVFSGSPPCCTFM